MVLVDSADCTSHVAPPSTAWETPKDQNDLLQAHVPDAPKRAVRTFAAEPSAATTLIPFATSTPMRHPIYALAEEPQQPTWKTPEPAAPTALAPKAPKRVQQRQGDAQDANPAKRRLFDDDEMPAPSPQAQKTQDDGGEWPSLVDDNAVDMVDKVSAMRADRCTPPDIPKAQRAKYNRLLDRLKTFGDDPPISPSDHAELKTDRVIRGTSYVDVLRALFVNSRYEVAGLCHAVEALRKAGVPANMLGSKRAVELYTLGHTIGQSGGAKADSDPSPPGSEPSVLKVYARVF
jgi:hypothetical protein